MPAREVFTEGNKVELAIKLNSFATVRNEHRGIVGAFLIFIDRPKKQVDPDRCGEPPILYNFLAA